MLFQGFCSGFYLAGEGQYKFEEFLPIYQAVSDDKDKGTHADFVEAFKTFDREGQGYISSAELRHVLTALGKKHFRWALVKSDFQGLTIGENYM